MGRSPHGPLATTCELATTNWLTAAWHEGEDVAMDIVVEHRPAECQHFGKRRLGEEPRSEYARTGGSNGWADSWGI